MVDGTLSLVSTKARKRIQCSIRPTEQATQPITRWSIWVPVFDQCNDCIMARTRLQPHTTESGKHQLASGMSMSNPSNDRLRIAVDPRLSAFLYVRSPRLPFHSHFLIYPDRQKQASAEPRNASTPRTILAKIDTGVCSA